MDLKITNYNKMPLRAFNEINKLRKKDCDAIDFEIGLIAILCDVSENDILNLPITEYQQLRAKAQFLADYPKDDNAKCPDKININGHKYNVIKNINDINTAQYIDYQSYLKMDRDENIQYVLSCFVVPEGKEYMTGYRLNDIMDDILDIDVVTALSICFFFLNLYLTYIGTILHYLELKMKKEMRKTKDKEMKKKMKQAINQLHSLVSGVGLIQ